MGTVEPFPRTDRQVWAAEQAELGLRYCRQAVDNGRVVVDALSGLDCISKASAMHPNLRSIAPAVAVAAPRIMLDLYQPLALAVEGQMLTDDVQFGLEAATALLTDEPDDLHIERLSFTCMLSSQLKIIFHRRELARRGNMLMQAVGARRMKNDGPLPGDVIH